LRTVTPARECRIGREVLLGGLYEAYWDGPNLWQALDWIAIIGSFDYEVS